MKIRPKKWEEFQHYKDIHYAKGAKPAWVKLHRKLLDDFEYQGMPIASQALAPMLWLIASEDPEGVIDAATEKLAFRLRWTETDVEAGLSPLIGRGFFEVVQFPKDEPRQTLDQPYSESRTEKKREEEKREEERRGPEAGAPDSAGTFGAAFKNLKAMSLQDAKIPGGSDTPAGILASILLANGCRGNAFHPSVVEWSRTGITPEKLKDAIAKARQRPGKEKGVIGPEYLNPILYDETKPAAQVHAEKARESSDKAIERTQKIIAEQRAMEKTPMPAHLRPKPIAH